MPQNDGRARRVKRPAPQTPEQIAEATKTKERIAAQKAAEKQRKDYMQRLANEGSMPEWSRLSSAHRKELLDQNITLKELREAGGPKDQFGIPHSVAGDATTYFADSILGRIYRTLYHASGPWISPEELAEEEQQRLQGVAAANVRARIERQRRDAERERQRQLRPAGRRPTSSLQQSTPFTPTGPFNPGYNFWYSIYGYNPTARPKT